jgi:hypothetical protein
LAGIVTTAAAPLTPVSAIENNSMTIPNAYLDSMSVSAIQNHRFIVLYRDVGVPGRRIADLNPQARTARFSRGGADEPGRGLALFDVGGGTSIAPASSSMICSIERVIMSISSSLWE